MRVFRQLYADLKAPRYPCCDHHRHFCTAALECFQGRPARVDVERTLAVSIATFTSLPTRWMFKRASLRGGTLKPRHQGRHRRPALHPPMNWRRTKQALPMLVALSVIVGLAALAAPPSHASTVKTTPFTGHVLPPSR